MKKILIANRGEIALRIIRTAKEMGIETVSVYSVADKDSMHVHLANESVCIGSAQAKDSYLNQDNIISAALNTGCDSIHPGVGFLSENAEFARVIAQHGLTFIGPKPEIIEQMGNKIQARKIMKQAGIPIIPGSLKQLLDYHQAQQLAEEIGYPVILKAAGGGGGRGMQVVRDPETMEDAFYACQQAAIKYFHQGEIYVEKLFENVKHIEVQILADQHGQMVHLYERDCSIQRKNQKLIEEAPCHSLDKALQEKIINDALKAAKAVAYDSVGTIEFLVQDQHHYFMEMNTRIQVEHPITEAITNVDLIKHQIRSAYGHRLQLKQEDIVVNGHAIECRINAEDIYQNFRPVAGKINFVNLPQGRHVRLKGSIYNGVLVSPHYDSLLLKIISFGQTRLEAIKKMRIALEELIIDGVASNEEFHYFVLHSIPFVEGKYDTGFVETFLKELRNPSEFI